MRKKLLTHSLLVQIPQWIRDEGLSTAQIAEKIGCTVGTLRVRCSDYGISLRQPRSYRRPCQDEVAPDETDLMLRLSQGTRVRVLEHARLRGLSDAELLAALIETIDRDDLYSAVLDDSR